METSAGGNLVVDETIDPIDPASTLYNIDNDLLANVPSLYYRESTLVGMNNWKVTEVSSTIDDGSSSAVTIMKVAKDGVEIALRYSNYLACTPMPNRNGGVESDNYKAILAKLGTIAVGDYVNVSGILSYYNKDSLQYNQSSYQILVQNADSIQKIDNGSDVTNSVGKQMATAIKAFTGFEDLYTSNTTISLPSTLGNATVTWAFHNPNHVGVTLEGNTLTIAPSKYTKVSLDATYTIGDYTTVVYYSFEVEKLSDADIANRVLESITLEETYDEGKVTLVTEADYAGATIEYTIKEGSANASIAEGKLVLVASTEDKQVVVTVKVTSGSTVVTKDLTLTVTGKPADEKVPTVVTNPVVGTAYKLGMVQENVEKTLFATGAMDGYYYATTEEYASAADIYLESTTGGYHMYTSASGAKKYMNIILNGTYINVVFEDAASSVWTYNAELNTMVTTTNNTEYYLGTRNDKTYTTFSACKVDSGAFVGQFYELAAPASKEYGVITNPVAGVAYKLQMVQENVGKTLYATGAMDGYYYATTEDLSAAADIYLEETTGGFHMYTSASGAKKYMNIIVNGTYINVVFEDAASSVWSLNTELNTLVTTTNNTVYYLGTRNDKTYTTFSACKVDSGAFVGQFYGEVTGGTTTPEEPTPTPDPVDPSVEPAVVETTVAQLVANVPTTSNDKIYVVEGAFFVADGVINAYNTYGNGRLVDPNDTTKSITIYGFAGSKDALAFADGVYTYTNPKHFPTLDINHGDKVKVGMVYDATNKRYSLYLIEVTGEMDLPKTEAAYDANALTKVTAANQLVEGAQLVIAFGTNMMGAHDGSKFARVAGTQVEVATGVETVTLVKSGDNWLLKLANGQYICYSGSKNNVSVGSATDTTAQWTIEIVDGMAVIKNVGSSDRVLQYNSNANQERFVCYKSTQNYVTLYIVK